MADTAAVIFAHGHKEHQPGDRANLPVDEARALVEAGYANYATKAAAKEASTPEARTATSTKAAGKSASS